MQRATRKFVVICAATCIALQGCGMHRAHEWTGEDELAHYHTRATQIEYPDVESQTDEGETAEQPFTQVSNPAKRLADS